MILIEQNNVKKPVTAIYFDGIKKAHYVKRFLVENTMSKFSFISEHHQSVLKLVSTDWRPQVEIIFLKEKGKERQTEIIDLEKFIAIKGEKALGNKLTSKKIKDINLLDSLPYNEIIAIEEEASELIEEIIEDVATKIELNITNESVEQINIDNKEDNETEGQITLEL
jgi:topoisomerase-4 subunit A